MLLAQTGRVLARAVSVNLYYMRDIPTGVHRPRVAQWLERPLGVREAGVRSPTASHQRGKKWEVFASQLGV